MRSTIQSNRALYRDLAMESRAVMACGHRMRVTPRQGSPHTAPPRGQHTGAVKAVTLNIHGPSHIALHPVSSDALARRSTSHKALTQRPVVQPSLSHVPTHFSEPLGTDEIGTQGGHQASPRGNISQEAELRSKLGPMLFWKHHGANIIKAVMALTIF